ncbi:Polycomb complex protein BMI-1 [Amphibalanus amphitrite]|uniref:Polycomb complex protein BMI-1 n=1 Tax=Amphibalanus amphitrite TaxID=1232801 RepID=A0A6A4W6H4_AMPAM|nr:Polycomb complex protein BMI-1 [Amphibalanus amphitrite]
MVPDLFTQEMQQRRDFYEQRPYADPELPSWAKGDVASYVPHVFTPDEPLQLRLAMFDADRRDPDCTALAEVTGPHRRSKDRLMVEMTEAMCLRVVYHSAEDASYHAPFPSCPERLFPSLQLGGQSAPQWELP